MFLVFLKDKRWIKYPWKRDIWGRIFWKVIVKTMHFFDWKTGFSSITFFIYPPSSCRGRVLMFSIIKAFLKKITTHRFLFALRQTCFCGWFSCFWSIWDRWNFLLVKAISILFFDIESLFIPCLAPFYLKEKGSLNKKIQSNLQWSFLSLLVTFIS